jgi:hypothetical protein
MAGVLADLAESDPPARDSDAAEPPESQPEEDDTVSSLPQHPLVETGWLQAAMTELLARYGSTFAAQWRADPGRLLAAAVDLLAELRMVAPVEGGVLILPLLARYRNVVVQVRRRKAEPTLFDVGDGSD